VLTRKLEVIPAVDVLGGRAVRLRGGRREEVILEGGDPVELARRFAADGATRLHVVDLEGAFAGQPSAGLVERMSTVGLPLQVGGGFRSVDHVAAALEAGADRVMVGTAALSPTFLAEAIAVAAEQLLVAIDVRDGYVAVDGWTEGSDLTPAALAKRCVDAGVARVLVTSAARDGSLGGPDLELLEEVLAYGLPVLAAGGIASLDDLLVLRELGCEGAVVGSALLAGRFTLEEALQAVGADRA
jgi:phosphoribosylformimino-5-aminoimidazole carboxamide ribotide isomerase